jgi:hypothetical protein
MKITWENLDLGEWKDVSKSYHKKNKQTYLELRLKNINKCVGKIYLSEHGCNVRALFSTESDGVWMVYNKPLKLNQLKEEWKPLMNELLEKIFKKDLVV